MRTRSLSPLDPLVGKEEGISCYGDPARDHTVRCFATSERQVI